MIYYYSATVAAIALFGWYNSFQAEASPEASPDVSQDVISVNPALPENIYFDFFENYKVENASKIFIECAKNTTDKIFTKSEKELLEIKQCYLPSSEQSVQSNERTKFWNSWQRKSDFQLQSIEIPNDSTNLNGVLIRNKKAKWDRWTIVCPGNAQTYESLDSNSLENMAKAFESNIILFNYPGVGLSESEPTLDELKNSYKSVWEFLENEVKATEVISYGYSIGGGIQAEALKTLDLEKSNIKKHAFIYDRAFSSLQNFVNNPPVWRRFTPAFSSRFRKGLKTLMVSSVMNLSFWTLLKKYNFGWATMDLKKQNSLSKRTLVLQSAQECHPFFKTKHGKICSDSVIRRKASLAYYFLKHGLENQIIPISYGNSHTPGPRHNLPIPHYELKKIGTYVTNILNDSFEKEENLITAS